MTATDTLLPPTEPLAAAAVPVVCADPGWAALRVTGSDAIAFLQGQLSSDVASLEAGTGQYWSYNSPKGRMLANGVLWRAPASDPEGGIVMLLAADLAATIRRRLSMFVLRAKVTIDDLTATHVLIGLAGAGCADAARAALGMAPPPATAVAFNAGAQAFALPDRRIVIVAPRASAPAVSAALVRHASTIDADRWRWFGIAAGIAWIGAATADAFVPQTANWDLVGGVSFRKGCYPGQEIVARMQYLGRLKERLFAFRTRVAGVAAGTRLYSATFGADQACGTVVDAAPDPAGGTALLAVAQITAVEADDLALGAPDGARLIPVPLPYAVPPAARESRPS